jgi:hypothetical protein
MPSIVKNFDFFYPKLSASIIVSKLFKFFLKWSVNKTPPISISRFISSCSTTSQSSQKIQRRDLALFRDFLFREAGSDERCFWTPRLSKAFKDHLKKTEWGKGKLGYSDRTINRIMAHLKTFAKWIHKLKPFALDNSMSKPSDPRGAGFDITPGRG